ncbi:hypothetical protein BABINDRAFT_21767, partial [Babjeviella inositovora NRRL Y-12698]
VRRDMQTLGTLFHTDEWLLDYETGEILGVEKMLVMVKYTAQQSFLAPFTDAEPYDTRVTERWKEYLLVVRSSGDMDQPLLVQFYKNRGILQKDASIRENTLDFTFTHRCTASLYSNLDKSIALTVPVSNGLYIYILKTHTQSASVRWLSLFRSTLGEVNDGRFYITVPDLHTSLEIHIPRDRYDELVDESRQMGKGLDLCLHNRTVTFATTPILAYLIDKCLEQLQRGQSPEQAELLTAWKRDKTQLNLVLRDHDRIEWIDNHTQAFVYSRWLSHAGFSLELRPLTHYPRETKVDVLHEPEKIEGFLCLLTTRKGHTRRRLMGTPAVKLVYFFSCENLLFKVKFFRAVPPLPQVGLINADGSIPNKEALLALLNTMDDVYTHSVYRLDTTGQLDFLRPETSVSAFQEHDTNAFYEAERKIKQVVKAGEVLDMCDIDHIIPVMSEEVDRLVRLECKYVWQGVASTEVKEADVIGGVFEIVMRNGCRIRLQTSTSLLRDEWVLRLTAMKDYWTARKGADLRLMSEVRQRNLDQLGVDEYDESCVGAFPWEKSNYVSSPELYNVSAAAMTSAVSMSGVLFQKPKKHASFKKYFVVLAPGLLILYNYYDRSASGNVVLTSGHPHFLTIALSECYVYSGNTTSLDLLKRDTAFDSSNPGFQGLPRIYSDGWKSSEQEPARCFTLWFGKKRAMSGKNHKVALNEAKGKKSAPKNPGIVKIVSRLGVTGNSMVFMARSAQEKDLWVTKLLYEIER